MPKLQKMITDYFDSKSLKHNKTKVEKKRKFITDFFKAEIKNEILSLVCKKANTSKMFSSIEYHYSTHYAKVRLFKKQKSQHKDVIGSFDGYAVWATNNFKEYTVCTAIDRNINGEIIFAGTEVATAAIDDDSALEHINVKEKFRRRGIGTSLIRFINQHDKQFHVYGGVDINSRYRLTQEGAALINACCKKGILTDEQVIIGFIPPSP